MKPFLVLAISVLFAVSAARAADGDPGRGQQIFAACTACHSIEPDKNMTGPSLAGLWNRKAGNLASFARYSPALKSSDITWSDKTLNAWIKDPAHYIPGNTMTFQGIQDDRQRSDLLAFLKRATTPGAPPPRMAQGQMGGMMGGGKVPNLKALAPEDRVQAIDYCKDTYRVTTADGKSRAFWERNLRLKTDASGEGPEHGAPGLVPAGMMGDRADVIFADPGEISGFIQKKC